MRLRPAAKVMTLYYTLKSAPFAHAHDVDKSLAFTDIHQHAVAGFDRAIALGFFVNFNRHFAHKLHRRKIVLSQMAFHRLRQARLLHAFHQTDLRRGVAIPGLRFVLRDHARTRLQNRRWMHVALVVKELRHPDFLSQNSRYLRHFLLRSSMARWLLAGLCGAGALAREASLRRTAEGGCPHALLMFFPECLNLHIHSGRKV